MSDARKYHGTVKFANIVRESTTNFEAWEAELDLNDPHELADLNKAIEAGRRVGKFRVETLNDNLLIMPFDGKLVLVLTSKSRPAYLRMLAPLIKIYEKKLRGGLSEDEVRAMSLPERIALFKKNSDIEF